MLETVSMLHNFLLGSKNTVGPLRYCTLNRHFIHRACQKSQPSVSRHVSATAKIVFMLRCGAPAFGTSHIVAFFPREKFLFCNDASPHVKTRPRSVSRFPLSPRRPSVPKSSLGTTDNHPREKKEREEKENGREKELRFSLFLRTFTSPFGFLLLFGLYSLSGQV